MKVAGSDLDISGTAICPATNKAVGISVNAQKIHSNEKVSGTPKSCEKSGICQEQNNPECLLKTKNLTTVRVINP
ncbi:Uncharacterised protein [uncultured archaeon]|nr:Uncharacterised protein [uncultured archaeon]